MKNFLCLLYVLLALSSDASGRRIKVPASPPDPAYVADYGGELVLRVFESRKYTRFAIGQYGTKQSVQYKPNANYNTGIGFNYRFLAINVGLRSPFVNDDNDKFGRTRYLDLQAYLYLRKMTLDFYGQSYKGYYLENGSILLDRPAGGTHYLRPDMRSRNLGANFEYVFNGSRFSYRAAYLQNERQLKSAGSVIVGAGVHWLRVDGDSSLVPSSIVYREFLANEHFNRSSVASFVIDAGYAQQLVFARRFFILGSIMAGVGLNQTSLDDRFANTRRRDLSPDFNAIARCAAGYNGRRLYVGIYYTTSIWHNDAPVANSWQQYETGILRLAVARRFTLNPRTQKTLQRITDKMLP